MNKYKKIAMSAVAVVMAGTMMVPLAACKPKKPIIPEREFNLGWDEEPTDIAENLKPKLNDNKQLVYDENTALTLNVGNQSSKTPQSIAYRTYELGGPVKMPDGKTYNSTDLKPAWAALQDTLKLKFTDEFTNQSKQLEYVTPSGNVTIQNYDIITASMSEINQFGDRYLLDLNDYIYYMPNYKAFLKNNPVTVFSLNGNTTTGALYAAPYFDGNNSIEKYELIRRDWVRIVLDGDVSGATGPFKKQATDKQLSGDTAITPYMGTTGSWTIDTTNPGKTSNTLTLTVSYADALSAAKNASSGLGKAIADAAGKAYTGDSGNIVDLQNFAIKESNGGATGAQLANILREYIKVTYKDGNSSFYNGKKYGDVTTKISDVFNASWGAWDVDLLAGLLRCIVSSPELFDTSWANKLTTSNLYGIMSRDATMQRRADTMSLVGQLYGVRGMETRYERATYLDKDGQLQDGRANPETYELISNMSGFAKEGLLYTGDNGTDGRNSYNFDGKTVAAMTYDYAQTQTRFAFNSSDVPEGYDFAPIVTPVSKWDEDCDASNGHEKIMRFTESWRATKNTGFCVPRGAVEGNPNKLSAILAFIDYLFSSDGQILMTYGERSTTGNSNPDGWWYAEKSSKSLNSIIDSEKTIPATTYAPAQYTLKASTEAEKEVKKQVFIYKGEVYEGTPYADRNVPTMTTANKDFFVGKTVNGFQQGTGDVGFNQKGSYTGYARNAIGSTLPLGNKDQGFEAQATADCAVDGQNVVDEALNNGAIQHIKNTVAQNESLWYLTVPTMLPTDPIFNSDASQKEFGTTLFSVAKATKVNVFMDLIYYGLGNTDHYICEQESLGTLKASGAAYVKWINDTYKTNNLGALDVRVTLMQTAWGLLDNLYSITGTSEK